MSLYLLSLRSDSIDWNVRDLENTNLYWSAFYLSLRTSVVSRWWEFSCTICERSRSLLLYFVTIFCCLNAESTISLGITRGTRFLAFLNVYSLPDSSFRVIRELLSFYYSFEAVDVVSDYS